MIVKWVKKHKFEELTGYTIKAIDKKIENGVWICGQHYKKAPDGNILINLEKYNEWVEHERH